MERQAGASHVELDTEAQWARVYFVPPTKLDFKTLVEAALSAAFPTVGMEVEVTGTVIERTCEHCQSPRQFLRMDRTGQELELAGSPYAVGAEVTVQARVEGWEGVHPVLVRN